MQNEKLMELTSQRKITIEAVESLKGTKDGLHPRVEEILFDGILEIDWQIHDLLYPQKIRPDSEIKVTFLNRAEKEIMCASAKETYGEAITVLNYEHVKEFFPDYFMSQNDGRTDLIMLGTNTYLRVDFDNKEKRRRLKEIASKFGEELKVVLSLKGSKTIIN